MRGATHNFEKNLLRVRWSEKDALLAAGSACQNVNIWDMKMLQLAYRLPGHTGSVNEVCFHPKEPIIASVASDRTEAQLEPLSQKRLMFDVKKTA
eukprot:g18272.t1